MKRIICILLSALMLLSLAACGSKGKDNDAKEDGPAAAAADNGGENAGAEGGASDSDDFTLEVTEEADRFIWRITDDTYWVIKHDGKKVTDFETWIYSDSAEDAKTLAESFQVLVNTPDSGMKGIYAKGRYLVYVFTEDRFPVQTYEEAKESYEAAKEAGF